ncbi:sugar phosphate nucleotidyltransferase [Paenibacillus methanolicus]|uniref:Mannose-1-phosphate guanylyltransferase n=1 Tax=Paenibacillus methanolicus TaxID=582686 RepID=A0A5S5BVE9_9BACL|nr:sugar phosphate nucleotidyltransferase [Paenibacillus methanolicus]TYP70286.1 mannose-1-phosphate guanylyltransferase [Paenibacillus methanolicus]
MKLVLLSGGSGKRLWPLSNDSRSKQFLKVLTSPEGQAESMVQRVWRQIEGAGFQRDSYIATSKAQVEMMQSQLGYNVPLIVEPERRDTFPAIALAATYLYSIQGVSLQETVTILPVDPYVEAPFFQAIHQLDEVLGQSGAELALIGVKPTYPSEKYGYIIPKRGNGTNDQALFQTVDRFQEKPSKEVAAAMIEQSALWNCGVFAFKLDYLINKLIELGMPIQYDEMLKQYGKLPKISFDYEVVEKAGNIAVLPYDGEWRDLGTWNTLTDEMDRQLLGKGIISEDSENTHLINELDIPVTILGLSNIVVATSPDGILVSDKSASPRVKDMLGGFDNRPMFEERRWGHYRVIDYVRYEHGNEVLTKRICIKDGCNLSYQYHEKRDEVWTVVSGEGEFIQDEEICRIKAGDVVKIPCGSRHSLKALTQMEIIEVQTGSELIEEDIIRLSFEWTEIVAKCN